MGWLPDRAARGDLAADHAQRELLVRVLGALSPRERAVVVLRFYADLSEREVALTLGMPAGTVKSSCARALAKLRVASELSEVETTREVR